MVVIAVACFIASPVRYTSAESNAPIIIIPGVLGTRLYSDAARQDLIWAPKDEGTAFRQLSDMGFDANNIIRELGKAAGILTASGELGFGFLGVDGNKLSIYEEVYYPFRKVDQTKQSAELREYGTNNTYEHLVEAICEYANTVGRSVYFFSYDWRKSNAQTADELRSFIVSDLGAAQVDLVCHSMGGLVASNYVARYGMDRINTVTTLATPYEGAPKLINAVLNYDFLNHGIWEPQESLDTNIGNILGDELLARFGLTRDLKSGWPGVAELAPTQEYVRGIGFFVDQSILGIPYAKEISLDTYNKYCGIIFDWANIEDQSASYTEYWFSRVINQQNSIRHEGYNVLAAYENTYFGVGTGRETLNTIIFKDGTTLDQMGSISRKSRAGTLLGDGDGTVPYQSATMLGYLPNSAAAGHYQEFYGFSHSEMAADGNDAAKARLITEWIIDILKSNSSTGSNTQFASSTAAYADIVALSNTDNAWGANYLDYTYHVSFIKSNGTVDTVDFAYEGDYGAECADVNSDGIHELIVWRDVAPEQLPHAQYQRFPAIFNVTSDGTLVETTLLPQYKYFYAAESDSNISEFAAAYGVNSDASQAAAETVWGVESLISSGTIPQFRSEDISGITELYINLFGYDKPLDNVNNAVLQTVDAFYFERENGYFPAMDEDYDSYAEDEWSDFGNEIYPTANLIADANLDSQIQRLLGSSDDIASLRAYDKTLVIDAGNVTSLAGIEHFESVRRVELNGVDPSLPLDQISMMPSLNTFVVTYKSGISREQIAKLTNIKVLGIIGSGYLEDFTFMSGLTQLEYLTFTNYSFDTTRGLETLTGLTTLGISQWGSDMQHSVNDISVIRSMPYLHTMDLGYNGSLTDFTPLFEKDLSELQYLSIRGTGISISDQQRIERMLSPNCTYFK
jgi:hypothetical protein